MQMIVVTAGKSIIRSQHEGYDESSTEEHCDSGT